MELTPEQFNALGSSNTNELTPEQFNALGTQAETQKQNPFTSSPQNFLSKIGNALISPAVTTLARPIQAIQSLVTGKTPEYNIPSLFGNINVPNPSLEQAPIKKQIGRSLQTLGLGLSPLIGGATIGAGSALEENKGIGSTITQGALGAILGKGTEIGVTKALEALPKASQILERVNLRLTPTQISTLGSKVDNVSKYITENLPIGTPEERFGQISNQYLNKENQLQNFLKTDAKDITISKNSLLKQLEGLKSNYQDERDVIAIEKQIDSLKNTLQQKYPVEIPVDRLNALKRSTYQNAYNKTGDKVADWVEHDMGDIFKTNIQKATEDLKIGNQSIEDFNKEYGTIIQARKLLKLAQGRSQLGLLGRMILGGMGASIGSVGGPIGGALGAAAGEEAGRTLATPIRSTAGKGLETFGKVIPSQSKQLGKFLLQLFKNSPSDLQIP